MDELDSAVTDELNSNELVDGIGAALELDASLLDASLLKITGELELLIVELLIVELLIVELALDGEELTMAEALLFVVLEATQAPRLQAPASKRLRRALRCSRRASGLCVGIMVPPVPMGVWALCCDCCEFVLVCCVTLK